MKPWIFGMALLATVSSVPAIAQTISPTEQAAIDLASARGALLYAYDQAAWHATDAMRARIADPTTRIGGWIVEGSSDAPIVTFFDRDPDRPKAVFVAQVRAGKILSADLIEGRERSLTPPQISLFRARGIGMKAMIAARVALCADASPNTAILPATSPDGPALFYLLTPRTDLKTIPFGGHYRVEISPRGEAGPVRGFTKSCIDLPTEPPSDSKAAFLAISHLLDPTPTEIHVFSSLAAHKGIVVITGKRIWIVDGATITLLRDKDIKAIPR